MTSIELQPVGGKERIVIRRESSPAASDTATVGSRSRSNISSKKTVLIIPDAEARRRGERVVITRSESPASDKADTGQGNRWPSTRDVVRSARLRDLQRAIGSDSQTRTRAQSASISVRGRNESKRRSKDTEAWIREQNDYAHSSQREIQERHPGESSGPSVSRSVPLPPGWEVRFSTELPPRMYFADHVSRTTTWHDPRLTHPQRVLSA